MSSSVPAEPDLLDQMSSISNVSQLVEGVKNHPDLMLAAIQALVRSKETASAELQNAQKRTAVLEKQAAKGKRPAADTESLISQFVDALKESKRSRSVMIPDPPVYTGSKEDFDIWRSNMLMKLNVNQDHFSDDQAIMVYIYSRLDTQCQAHLHAWVSNGFIKFPSAADMMETLNVIFHDPNLERDASARLHSNPQNSKPFSVWISEIRRDAAIANYAPNSIYLRDLVFHNLSLDLKKALVHERGLRKMDFNEAVACLQDIENEQKSYLDTLSKSNQHQPPPQAPHNLLLPRFNPVGHPMDLSAADMRSRGSLSTEEKTRRRQLGLCMYCGGNDHLVRSCPVKSARFQVSGKTIEIPKLAPIRDSGNA